MKSLFKKCLQGKIFKNLHHWNKKWTKVQNKKLTQIKKHFANENKTPQIKTYPPFLIPTTEI
jgi:hypothetical protein